MANQLVTVDTIHVPTAEGTKDIQLLFGDITKLPLHEAVDLIMVSAFKGDYAPFAGTVIGALRSIGLHVRDLALDKAEDLRRLCYCWWSHPLPNTFPYRRLLCFETSGTQRAPQMAVNDMFRALISASCLFPDSGGSIMSPLLSTGDQGFSSTMMLRALVDAAANWMQCGLNVRTFKIVVYRPSEQLKELFGALKLKWESKVVRAVEETPRKGILTNLYLCYHQMDANQVNMISGALQEKSPSIRMDKSDAVNLEQEDWMVPVSARMKNYSRVLVFLSPAFVNDETCVQLYNLALCTSRLMYSGFLSPFYIASVAPIPTYMTMVQWIDVRITTDGNLERLHRNVDAFSQNLLTSEPSSQLTSKSSIPATPATSETSAPAQAQRTYKVFISYCHKDSSAVELVVQRLEKSNPQLSVFFDRKELRVGTSWQLALYDTLQKVQVVVIFLSASYAQSAMCQEEFALSILRYCTAGSSVRLLPILLDEVADDAVIGAAFAGRPIASYRGQQDLEQIHSQVCKAVERFEVDGALDVEPSKHPREPLNATSLLRSYRQRLFDEVRRSLEETCENGRAADPSPTPAPDSGGDSSCSALIISSAADALAERRLREVLDDVRPGRRRLTVLAARGGLGAPPRYKQVDDADVIVALISHDIVGSPEDYEELQVAISRQRRNRGKRILYPVLTYDLNTSVPLYLNLLCYIACTNDDLWSWKRVPSLGLSSEFRGAPRADSENDLPLTSCMEFCRNVIELDLRNKIPRSIPGGNGDVLLNIVSVKLWLSAPIEKKSSKTDSKADFATTLGHILEDRVNSKVQPGNTMRGYVPRSAISANEGSVANEQQATSPKPIVRSAEPQRETVEDLKEASAKDSSRVSTACKLL